MRYSHWFIHPSFCSDTISTPKDGITMPTSALILTFASPRPPITFKAGYINCSVWPLGCFHCQQFGCSKTSWHGSLTCACCGSKDHDAYECGMNPPCVNCNGSHPFYFHSCPKWLEEKDMWCLKTIHNISYPEARKLLSATSSRTYAAALRSTTRGSLCASKRIVFKTNEKPFDVHG
ncbi:uncharacterized protein LOC143222917 isoform X1 [Tachypleus tridentatus]|uniref:uncharacterized protein LOC143222917 isoform X1 n=1 Tax=Tachypleus tridentatus TaxID=6853 RepID=UPI003FD504A9